jgi:hypothetical protein
MENQNVTAIKIGKGENQIVTIEELLMKLALAEAVIGDMSEYVTVLEANDGVCPDHIQPPDTWAMAGMTKNLADVGRALKCACWGHEAAYLH